MEKSRFAAVQWIHGDLRGQPQLLRHEVLVFDGILQSTLLLPESI
jgi:hypothetical protein